jgi:hypothetical protein
MLDEANASFFTQADAVGRAGLHKLGDLRSIALCAALPSNKDRMQQEFKRKKRQQSQRGRQNRELKKIQKVEMQKELARERAEIMKRRAREELAAQTLAEAESRKGLSWKERQQICQLKRQKVKARLAECRKELEDLQNPMSFINESLEEKQARERRLLDLWLAEMRMIIELEEAQKEFKQAQKEAMREKYRQKLVAKQTGLKGDILDTDMTESDDEDMSRFNSSLSTSNNNPVFTMLGDMARKIQYWYNIHALRRQHRRRSCSACSIQQMVRERTRRRGCKEALVREIRLRDDGARRFQTAFRAHTCQVQYKRFTASKLITRVYRKQQAIKAARAKRQKRVRKRKSICNRWKKAGETVIATSRAKKERRRRLKAKARIRWVKAKQHVVGKLRFKKLAVHLSRMRQERREMAKAVQLQAWFRACRARREMEKWFGYYGVTHMLPKRRSAVHQVMDMDNVLNISAVKCLGCGGIRELIVAGRCAICAKNKVTLNSLNRVSSVHRKRLKLDLDDYEDGQQGLVVAENERKRDLAMAAVRGALHGALMSYSHALGQMGESATATTAGASEMATGVVVEKGGAGTRAEGTTANTQKARAEPKGSRDGAKTSDDKDHADLVRGSKFGRNYSQKGANEVTYYPEVDRRRMLPKRPRGSPPSTYATTSGSLPPVGGRGRTVHPSNGYGPPKLAPLKAPPPPSPPSRWRKEAKR